MKRILIITANYTGHGHRSISDSITEQLVKHEDVDVRCVDGFSLIGPAGVKASKLYGPFTRNVPSLWKTTFSLTDSQPSGMNDMMSALIAVRLMRLLREFNPDMIVTVHSMFNTAILNILEKNRIRDIPFIVCQADLINIHSSWCDPRATRTICLTDEGVAASLAHGMTPESLVKIGFPTRARFCDAARSMTKPDYTGDKPLRCLMMSGGDGGSDMLAYGQSILQNTNCHMTFICGRDKNGRERLTSTLLPVYSDRIEILGFVDNVEEYMQNADLLIARGSPNTLMEAVVMNLPVMITGCLPGQEADNPAMMVAHNLAITCDSPVAAPMLIKALTDNNGSRLREIREAQRNYRNLDNAKNIAEYIYEHTEPLKRPFPKRKQTIAK